MIQRNAIKSWTLLPDVEVILLGEETGLAEAARELGVKHISNVERNANGTPLISSMFQLARENSQQRTALHHQRGHDPHARFCRSSEYVGHVAKR